MLVTAVIYTIVSVALITFASTLVVLMAQEKALLEATVKYVRLETVAALFATLWRFMMTVIITAKKDKYLYIVLGVQTVLSVLLDTFLVSQSPASAKLGVDGIAITNIIVNAVLVIC